MRHSNGTRFIFLNTIGPKYDVMLKEVNMILNGEVKKKPYEIDWDLVLKQYKKLGVGDIDEFCCNYTFGYHIFNRKLEDKVSKEAMYMELRNCLHQLREKGEIP